MSDRKRLRIVSDGTPEGTHVYAGDVELQGITGLSWQLSVDELGSEILLTVVPESVELTTDFEPESRPIYRLSSCDVWRWAKGGTSRPSDAIAAYCSRQPFQFHTIYVVFHYAGDEFRFVEIFPTEASAIEYHAQNPPPAEETLELARFVFDAPGEPYHEVSLIPPGKWPHKEG